MLLFTWGLLTFTCVLARVSQRFIMFRPDGVPVRARLQVTFNEFINAELEGKEIKRETADYSHRHIVHDGETLSSIAANVYHNATLWRPIAIFNQIDNPHLLETGRELLIPQLPFRDPETGGPVCPCRHYPGHNHYPCPGRQRAGCAGLPAPGRKSLGFDLDRLYGRGRIAPGSGIASAPAESGQHRGVRGPQPSGRR